MTYIEQNINLTNNQKKKLNNAIKKNVSVSLRITPENISGDESDPTILLTRSQVQKIDTATTHGRAVDITLSKTQLSKIKSGGFLGALLGGLAASILPNLLGIGKGLDSGMVCECCKKKMGSGVFLGKAAPPKPTRTSGLFLSTQPRMYMSHKNKVYDISVVKTGEGFGTLIAQFLPKVLPIVKGLAKNVLGGLAIGAASEGASQAVKAIAKRGSGIYLKTGSKKGGMIYDVTPIIEQMSGMRYGSSLLSSIFGFKSPFKDIPVLGSII